MLRAYHGDVRSKCSHGKMSHRPDRPESGIDGIGSIQAACDAVTLGVGMDHLAHSLKFYPACGFRSVQHALFNLLQPPLEMRALEN